MALSDLFNGCYSGEHQRQSPEEFKAMFCRVCENPTCKNSKTGQSRWMSRILTQEDRLLINPKFALDGAGDSYPDFHDMVRQALSAEISTRKGDWSVPTDAEVREAARELLTAPVGFQKPPPERWCVKGDSPGAEYEVSREHEGNWTCTCKAFTFGQGGCKHISDIQTKLANAPEESVPAPQGRPAPFLPPSVNTAVPAGGILVGGPKEPENDPWAVPERKVGVGARVTLGGGKSKS